MKAIVLAVVAGIALAAAGAAQAMPNSVVKELTRTGSTISVHGFADYR